MPVPGTTRAEFDSLIGSTAARLGIAELLTSDYRESLFEEADGHPYVGKMLLNEVARTKTAGSVERIMAGREDVLNALFERTYNSISPAARRVFLTLSNWRSPVPRLALEAALLRPTNERVNVADALTLLEQSSLIERISTGEEEGEFLRIPLAAYVFGQQKLRVSPAKAAIESDTEVIRMFGAAQRSEVGRELAPRVERMLRAVAKMQSEGRDVSAELEIVGYVARKFPPARLQLAEYHLDDGRHDEAIKCLASYLEATPYDRRVWLWLADLYVAQDDGRGEVFARVEAARLPGAPLADVSNAASTLNRHNFRQSAGLSPDESRSMAEGLVGLLASREQECDANDFSRLAWLYLHLGKSDEARRVVELGLRNDPSNRHCVGLASRLDVSIPTL